MTLAMGRIVAVGVVALALFAMAGCGDVQGADLFEEQTEDVGSAQQALLAPCTQKVDTFFANCSNFGGTNMYCGTTGMEGTVTLYCSCDGAVSKTTCFYDTN